MFQIIHENTFKACNLTVICISLAAINNNDNDTNRGEGGGESKRERIPNHEHITAGTE